MASCFKCQFWVPFYEHCNLFSREDMDLPYKPKNPHDEACSAGFKENPEVRKMRLGATMESDIHIFGDVKRHQLVMDELAMLIGKQILEHCSPDIDIDPLLGRVVFRSIIDLEMR